MLLRRFFCKSQKGNSPSVPHYVKVIGLPDKTWYKDLKKLLEDKKYEFMPRRSYIAIETWSAEEAEHVKSLIHMKKLEDGAVLKATNLLTVADLEWIHPIFHIRPDFAVPPEKISQREFESLHRFQLDDTDAPPNQKAMEQAFHAKAKKHFQETEAAKEFASLVKKQPKIV